MSAADPVVLAVDAGTGSARVLAVDAGGRIVAAAAREWTHHPLPGHPGGTVFDTDGGWRLIASAFREVVAAVGAARVAAIAPSSMREGFVLLDRAGTELWACPNTDGRSRAQAEALVSSGAADRIFAVGGDWVSITAPARLRWIAEHEPELLERTGRMLMLSDWIAFRLTGVPATEPTCGSSSAMFDLARREWSAELAHLVGVDPVILPDVVECGTVIGTVTPEASAATGLPHGVPVVAGGADTQLALHAIAARPDVPTVVAGTFWQTTAVTPTPVIDPRRRLRTLCHVERDRWMVEGIGFLSGLAMRWFRDGFCADLVRRAAEDAVGRTAYQLMEEEAAASPRGSAGVLAILSDVMQADGWHHAAPAFVGYDLGDPAASGRAASIRAIEEAAAYVARAHLDILDELTDGATASGELVFTGGSSGGRLWPRIVAEATGRRVARSAFAEATSYGAARLAGAAVGVELDPVPVGDPVVPDAAAVAEYAGLRARWTEAYRAQSAATRAADLDPLFVPPGGLPPHHRPSPRPTGSEHRP